MAPYPSYKGGVKKVGKNVPVGEHGALGKAGRPAGVKDKGHIRFTHINVDLLCRMVFDHLFIGQFLRLRSARVIDKNIMLNRFQLRLDFINGIGEFLLIYKSFRFGIVYNVFQLSADESVIHGNDYKAALGQAVKQLAVFDAVLEKDGNTVALFKASAIQRPDKGIHSAIGKVKAYFPSLVLKGDFIPIPGCI